MPTPSITNDSSELKNLQTEAEKSNEPSEQPSHSLQVEREVQVATERFRAGDITAFCAKA